MSNGLVTTLSVSIRGHAACVRIVGRANFTSSLDFKRLVQQLQDGGCDEIVLDLKECRLMDSTFLGVLAGIGSKCDAARSQGDACLVELFQPSEKVSELLDNLGVLGLFKVINDAVQFEGFQPVEEGHASRTELTRTCYEAHKTLMHTSPENERRFKDAAQFFEQNLRKDESKE